MDIIIDHQSSLDAILIQLDNAYKQGRTIKLITRMGNEFLVFPDKMIAPPKSSCNSPQIQTSETISSA